MNPIDSAQLLKDADDLLSRRPSHGQAEVYLSSYETHAAEWSEGAPENRLIRRGKNMGVRWIHEGRLGFAYSNTATPEAADESFASAQAAQHSVRTDDAMGLPASTVIPQQDLQLTDPTLEPQGFESRADFLKDLEATVRQRDPRFTKVLSATYQESWTGEAIVSTSGVRGAESGTTASFSIACVAVQGTETQVGYGHAVSRHASDLDIAAVVDKTTRQTLALLNGRQIASGRYDLIFDPWIMAEMLELYGEALRADHVQKGKSFFAAYADRRVGSPQVTFMDEPHRRRGLGSCLRDAEGVPTQNRRLVEAGVLRHFLYDTVAARRAGQRSSGNAVRGSSKSLPEPGISNFYLAPGSVSPERLIGDVKKGIYIHHVMGLHTVDTISGDYSLGIMGEFIEHGQRTHGVRGVTIAGSLLGLLEAIDAVGSDLTFAGSVGSPTVRARDISVGGSA